MDDPVISYSTKELLEKIDTKLDRMDTKLDQKADSARVENMIETMTARFASEIARVDAIIAPLVDPKTGVYSLIEASGRRLDGRAIGLLGSACLLLAGILFKKYLGLA